MVESTPQSKNDEQFPLLMVNSGGGDSTGRQPPTVVSSVWNVTSCTPAKASWRDRWPELLSACWMTFILLGISFLVFYAIGIVAYRQQTFFIIKCNNTKPASDVYFHHIIQHANAVPFMGFSDYLSNMATQYPLLRFNVIFLVDDTIQSAFSSRQSSFYAKLIPFHPATLHDEYNKREMRHFLRQYLNVNITVIPLSKYMALTPLKYKWRTIPIAYLPFYARVFSVWQNGGIGIDLSTYNNYHTNNYEPDERLREILKHHNNGIKTESYSEALNKLARDDDNDFLFGVFTLLSQLLTDTRTFFNSSFYQVAKEKESMENEPTLVRTHRNKRDVSEVLAVNVTKYNVNETSTATTSLSTSDNSNYFKENTHTHSAEKYINKTKTNSSQVPDSVNITNGFDLDILKLLLKPNFNTELSTNKSELPQVVVMYDVSVLTGDVGPSMLFPEPIMQANRQVVPTSELIGSMKPQVQSTQLLSLETNGLFVSATVPFHPFLGHLLSGGCRRTHPKYAIQDALYTECPPTVFRNEAYCNNIFVF